MPDETRTCACGAEYTRSNPRFRWPTKCDDCRGRKARPANVATVGAEPEADAPAFDCVATIAALGLDYCVGSAFRFLAEVHDGDELENLRTARQYLDAAITAREAT